VRHPNFGGNSFEIVQSIPTHSSEVRQEQVNPRNNGEFEHRVRSSSPRPEDLDIVEKQEGGKKEQREALMTAETNNQPIKGKTQKCFHSI
jgi:hypothetical protein